MIIRPPDSPIFYRRIGVFRLARRPIWKDLFIALLGIQELLCLLGSHFPGFPNLLALIFTILVLLLLGLLLFILFILLLFLGI